MDDFGLTPEQIFANKFLTMSENEFDAWAEKSTVAEIAHATAIIAKANEQLREQMDCLIEEDQYYIESDLESGYFPEAEEVLSKFTLH